MTAITAAATVCGALLHVIGLVDWPKPVKSFFFFFRSSAVTLAGLALIHIGSVD